MKLSLAHQPPCPYSSRDMTPIARTLVATLAAVAVCAPALAQTQEPIPTEQKQPELAKLLPPDAAQRPFTVAVALGSPPDDFRDQNGQVAGWEPDILRAATQALGLELDLRPTTFDTLIPGLQAKRFDAATGQIGITVVREKVVDMIGTLIGNELFAALAGDTIKVDSLDDLCGVAVATTRGSREMAFAEEHQPKCKELGREPINTLVFNDGNGAAEALMSRRARLYWVGSTAISYFVAQSHGRTKVVGHYTERSFIGVAMPKDSDMVKPLQAAIQHIMDDGTYTKIVTKWGLQDGAVQQAPVNPTDAPK